MTARRAKGEGDRTGKPLERYLQIIEVVAGFPGGIALPRLGEALGLPKTTVHRLAGALVETGMLAAAGSGYTLGPRFRRLAYIGTPDEWIASISHTILEELAQKTGQACFVAKLAGGKIRSVAMEAPDSLARGYVLPGRELWPHAAASAKAILAFQPEEAVRAVLPSPLPRLTRDTKTRLKDVFAELAEVRARRLAYCAGEDVEGFAGIACPVVVADQDVAYSVALTGTVEALIRRGGDELERSLRGSAEKLARAIAAQTATAGLRAVG